MDRDVRLPDWLAHRARSAPDRIALAGKGTRWTYAELDAAAALAARRLSSFAIQDGDRVAVLAHNDPRLAILLYALLRLGAILVPLNVRLSESELSWQLSDCSPRLLIADRPNSLVAERASAGVAGLRTIGLDELDQIPIGPVEISPAVLEPLALYDPGAVLAIIYTSGTTGRPKGAMLTVGNFWWSAIGSALNLGARSDDRWLACLPLFHVGGLSILIRSAVFGFTAVIHESFEPEAVNLALDEHGITIVSVVAVMLQRMLDERDYRRYPSSLRFILLGGGPAPVTLLKRCADAGIPVVPTYGLTETASQVVTLSLEDAGTMVGTAGKPLYPNAVRIVRENGDDAIPGESGEIIVRGPVVMAGYWGQSGATGRAIIDNWLHTSDIGCLDTDGYLYVLDRRDDIIVTGGENVYPAEVEAALLTHPAVAEAGVTGEPDARWGQRVVAIVRLTDTAVGNDLERSLIAHCSTLLARYKVPREIRFASRALPRTGSGKILRSTLLDLDAG